MPPPPGPPGGATLPRYPAKVHDVEVKRRLGEDDIAEIADLLMTIEAADHHAALGEHQWLDLVQGGRGGTAGFVARGRGRARVLGYAQLQHGAGSYAIELAVHPAHRGDGVGGDLLAAALGEVAAQGGGHVHLWIAKPTAADDAMAAAAGMRRGRELYQMRRALPLEEDLAKHGAGLSTRAFVAGEDEDAWLALNNRIFSAHPEQGSWSRATIVAREAQPWFDPAGFLLHERDGRLAGFCWTKVADPDDPAAGEIYVIGVDPDLHGRGLGRALLAAGCAHLSAAGCPSVFLYVDAANTAAVGLYRSFAFAVDHHDRAYVADVPASNPPR